MWVTEDQRVTEAMLNHVRFHYNTRNINKKTVHPCHTLSQAQPITSNTVLLVSSSTTLNPSGTTGWQRTWTCLSILVRGVSQPQAAS